MIIIAHTYEQQYYPNCDLHCLTVPLNYARLRSVFSRPFRLPKKAAPIRSAAAVQLSGGFKTLGSPKG